MAWNGSSPNVTSARPTCPKIRIPFGVWIIVGIVAVMAGVGWLATISGPQDEQEVVARKIKHNPERYARAPQDAVRAAMPAKAAGKRPKRRVPRSSVDLFSQFQGEDRKLAEKVQAGLDADDLNATVRAATAALQSENPELRMNAVEALGWFGLEALPELTACMLDSNEDVRQSAQNLWEQAVQGIEQPPEQFDIVAAAFATLSGEESLVSLSGILCNAATDMIERAEDENTASENRMKVLQTLVDIIEGKNAENAEAAKAAYNDITGNEWMGVEEAERYLEDPDNYDSDGSSAAAEDALPSEGESDVDQDDLVQQSER